MSLTTLTDLERLDATLNDVAPCDVRGCVRPASWRSKCADCDGSTLLLCELCKAKAIEDLKRKQFMGVVIQCAESHRIGKPLVMVLFIPVPQL